MEEKETIRPIEITWEELQSRDLDRYILVDTRGDEAVNYGMIPGAIAIPECELVDKLAAAAGDHPAAQRPGLYLGGQKDSSARSAAAGLDRGAEGGRHHVYDRLQ